MVRQVTTLIFLLILVSLACTLTRNSPTPVPLTYTPNYTATALGQFPTATPTSAVTATPTSTATITFTPSPSATPTITPTPLPTSTALATAFFANDNVSFTGVSSQIAGGLDRAWVAFTITDQQTNPNEAEATATAQVETLPVQRVYLAHPNSGQRILVLELPAATDNRIYWSPTGLHLAYFIQSVDETVSGLYLFNVQTGRSIRLYQSQNLQPRQIIGHQPVWSPDGTRLAFVLTTAYATDVFIVNADGTGFTNLTHDEAYDFWPAWSSDSKRLAFVSDRALCPTWAPHQPHTCDRPDAPPSTAGHLYIYNFDTARLEKISDNLLNAPPIWANESLVSVSQGSLDVFSEVSELWVYDVAAGSTWQLTPPNSGLYTAPTWTRDGLRIVYQRIAQQTSEIIETDRYGAPIARTSAYTFVRFGLAAAWSPDGRYIALAGRNGQCPYGLIVLDSGFTPVSEAAENLLACDPAYAPEGDYLAYEGILVARGTDGRLDIYIADANGQNPRNITRNMAGSIHLLGWVGPTFRE